MAREPAEWQYDLEYRAGWVAQANAEPLAHDASTNFVTGWMSRRSHGRPALLFARPELTREDIASIADRIDL
jgi:hypothetical protein